MTIRPMRMEDYDGVVDVWRRAGLDFKPTGRESRESVEKQLAHFPGTMLVAENDGRIVGVAFGTHDYRKGWINRLSVAPEAQGGGVAKRLVAAIESELERIGVFMLSATIMSDNEKSKSLAGKSGYTHHGNVSYFSKKLRDDW